MDYQVRNEKIEELLRDIGRTLGYQMPPQYGFALLIFTYANASDEQAIFYISSANREDMIQAMQEFIAKNQ